MVVSIALVTPAFNAGDSLDRTIMSIVSQAGPFSIRYHVQDAASTDGTQERLAEWERRLHAGDFPLQCSKVSFTWASEPDEGMYDALLRGFGRMNLTADRFMSWVRAGDVLVHGALARVAAVHGQFRPQELSWLAGTVATLRDDMIVDTHDEALPTRAIRAGLCDGTHWPLVQQEGVFFRKWLWDAVDAGQTLAPHKRAGDWALWRAFAHKASLVQTSVPLGASCQDTRQAAAGQHDDYMAEIDAVLSVEARRAELRTLLSKGDIRRRTLSGHDPAKGLSIHEEPAYDAAARHYGKLFGTAPTPSGKAAIQGRTLIARGRPPVQQGTETAGGGAKPAWLLQEAGIIGMDADWQFPAITEQHAFARLSTLQSDMPQGALYVAFPWATLIDKLQTGAPDRQELLSRFETLCALLPPDRHKVTVCQHIFARKYADLFRQANIQDVFWTHATHDDGVAVPPADGGPRFHPFPLYPVQTPEALPSAAVEADEAPRKHLFSFIGAKANKFYLTQARSWILEHLAEDPRGLVQGREKWHYQRVVYDLQVRKTTDEQDSAALVDSAAADEFREALCNSIFALCPAGTGPNSIRLWEAIAAGSIPVILADTWLPPGDRRLWNMAAVFCKETPDDIRALPDRLAAIAENRKQLADMRHAMRQLWLLYGAPFFISDLLEFMLTKGHAPAGGGQRGAVATAPLDAGVAAQQLLVSWSGRLLVDPAAALDELETTPALTAALVAARARNAGQSVQLHFDAALARATVRTGRTVPQLAQQTPTEESEVAHQAAPAVSRAPAPVICLFGRHAHRTPLAYDAFRRHIGDRIAWTNEPGDADLVVTGFDLDFRENAQQMQALTNAVKGPRLAVISEEPLWDVTWSGAPEGRQNGFEKDGIALNYAHLAHGTSDIFSFDTLPYYMLTEDRFITRFSSLIARQAQRTPASLLQHWKTAPLRAAFVAEKRTGDKYRLKKPEGRIVKLSAYRTELAERMQQSGALCMGKGWNGSGPRQALPDWHLDKLARLHDRCTLMGAQENMHHGLYISEKIFDAFACGSVPVYFAGPGHRVFELVPEDVMVNTYGLDVETAADRLHGFAPDAVMAERWLNTARRLATLFADFALIERERARVANSVVAEVRRVV